MKVLVVEDDDLVRTVVVDALEEAGFQVIEAATGEQAMARCKERTADALFTDITLPGRIDGWDIAEYCREADPHLPVVYATGYSIKLRRLVPGARLFQKPYNLGAVTETIRDLIMGRRSARS
jgi:CheY-like chemotaxis protein